MTSLTKTFRFTVLLVLLGATFLTVVVNGNIDPRFYRFLKSGHGKTVAGIMGWSVDFDLLPADKPESEMTDVELEEKRRLEGEVSEGLPKHQLVLRSGEVLKGEVVGQDDAGVYTFLQSFGDAGSFCAHIPDYRVLRVESLGAAAPNISYRDVQFSMEFPQLKFYRRSPYSVVTDQNYLQVERAVRDLQRLHHDFARLFGPLVTLPDRGDGIQLLFFQDQEQYEAYQRGYAPQLEHTAGFYSPKIDRFVVFNQAAPGSRRANALQMVIRRRAAAQRRESFDNLGRVKDWEIQAGRNVVQQAEEQTRMTIRHEGAHQLFFTYGVHSRHHAENSWLIEGLATYCETVPPGGPQAQRMSVLKNAQAKDRLIPLSELVNSRSPKGLYAFWGDKRVQLAYAESWALVGFLMRDRYREAFFDYLAFVRDPAHIDALAATPRIKLLAEALDMDVAELERLWDFYVTQV